MKKRQGFTLLETVMAVAVFSVVIAATMGSWLLFMYKSHRVNNQATLDMDVRKTVERFRAEMRNTARETIVFYPQSKTPYDAVGFAMASDTDGDGLMDMSAGGSNILWRETVIYHVWNHSPHQMRRTVFQNRNPEATYAERYNQISTVVNTGDGRAACLDGETTKTMVLFENLYTGKLWHAEARFDGYAPRANTPERLTFGSIPLGPGEHTITFTILDKNANSSGRALRLDQVSASVSGWPLEAELCTAGGSSSAPDFVGQGVAGGAYGLLASTSADGDTLTLKVLNDAIEECVFIGDGRNVTFSNTVVRFDSEYRPTGFGDGVYAAKLDGQFKTTWWGSVQAVEGSADAVGRDVSSSDVLYKPGTNCAVRIPVWGGYVRQDGFGPIFRMYKSADNNSLQIFYPAFAATETPDSPNISGATNLVPLAFYQNGVKKARWIDCAAGGVDLVPATGSLQPVYAGQSFILSLQMTVADPANDAIRAFRISDSSASVCWIAKGGDAAMAMKNVWGVGEYEALRDKEWTGTWKPCLPGLVNLVVNYAQNGDYVSHVFDTKDEAGKTKSFSWESSVPTGAGLTLYARGGNALTEDGFGISDAAAWENVPSVSSGGTFSGGTGRYVQFRAVFVSQTASQYPGTGGLGNAGPYRSATPLLRRALFTWDGDERYVEVSANLLKGPDCGIFKVDVDGKEMVRGVTMEIEIFKDVRTQGGVQSRLRSAMTAEVDPRNSGK